MGYEKLGLDPKRVYHILRDPYELEKAASTFSKKQLVIRHIPVNASDPKKGMGKFHLGCHSQSNW
ncbi:DUF2213 domain-containing protein [Photorhabdus sp. RM157S]|uniref:DUF2213 domain-containing protein n=1 Tax=Photorhabdus sp. RM157S TaxID=3342827 RepID=UPI0036DE5E97